MITLALTAGLHCTARADTWSLLALVVADGNLQPAGERYSRHLVQVARDAGWSLALQLDNGTDRPVRAALQSGRHVAVTEHATSTDATDPVALTEFFRWARAIAPAENHAVVVFGHGVSASGRGWDGSMAAPWPALALDGSSGASPLRPEVLASAMRDGLGGAADLIVLDSCYSASLEVIWDVSDCADVIVASPGRAPSSGVRWEAALSESARNAGEMGRRLATANGHVVAISTGGLTQVAECVRDLSDAVVDQIDMVAPALSRARGEVPAWGSEAEMCDLRALCGSLADVFATEIAVSARRAVVSLDACILSESGAVTVPWLPGMRSDGFDGRPAGFNEISRWEQMIHAYRDRQHDLMHRTLQDGRHGEGAT